MLDTRSSKRQLNRPSESGAMVAEKKEPKKFDPYNTELNCVDSSLTDKGFRYRLKLPGYVAEDFRCYRTSTHLVITTEKNNENRQINEDGKSKHNYCYASALFTIHIPLPKEAITNQVEMRYVNDFLQVDLFKQ